MLKPRAENKPATLDSAPDSFSNCNEIIFPLVTLVVSFLDLPLGAGLVFVTRPIDRFNLFSTLYNLPPLSVNEMCNSYYHKTNCHHLTLLKRNFQVGDFLLWQQRYGTKKSLKV
jgi:hypothetical protein